MFPELVPIGHISKAHGFKGGLKLLLSVELLDESNPPEFLWVNLEGKPVPHLVTQFKLETNEKAQVHFEDIESEEQTFNYKNKEVYFEAKSFTKHFAKVVNAFSIIGYKVIDKEFGALGVISDVIENNVQPTLVIYHNDKEVLIPYTEEVILDINEQDNVIQIDAPNGLINMYLND